MSRELHGHYTSIKLVFKNREVYEKLCGQRDTANAAFRGRSCKSSNRSGGPVHDELGTGPSLVYTPRIIAHPLQLLTQDIGKLQSKPVLGKADSRRVYNLPVGSRREWGKSWVISPHGREGKSGVLTSSPLPATFLALFRLRASPTSPP